MPYLPEGIRKELMTEPQRAKDNVGAMNFLFSEAILKVWNANPCYETIHNLRLATSGINPNTVMLLKEIDAVTDMLAENGVITHHIETAMNLAFTEFYLRIGQFYEREKMKENGDLPGYETAIKHLNELSRANFDKRIGFTPKESV